jgi:hypothetical protein
MTQLLILALFSLITTALTAVWMERSLHAVGATLRLTRRMRWRSAGAGAGIGFVICMSAGIDADLYRAVPVILFCAILAGLSAMDLRTAWAPDLMTGPLCLLAPFAGAALSGDAYSWMTLMEGMGIIGLAAFLWIAQCMIGAKVLPPPDAMVLIIPVFMFGISMELSVFFMLLAIVMLFCLRISAFKRIFARPEVVADIAKNESSDGLSADSSITAIAIAGPLLLATIAVKAICGV